MPRRSTVQHTIPQNPLFVAFPKTDGDKARWPRNTMEVVGNDGQVNYMVPHEEDSSLAIKYRVEVAIALKNYYKWTGEGNYVLESLPKDYKIFEHLKGSRADPRSDVYLFGSVNAGQKFRSVNEFIPHAIWLFQTDPTMRCGCRYCSGAKNQGEITQALSAAAILPPRASGSPSRVAPSVRRTTQRQPKRQMVGLHASVLRPLKVSKGIVDAVAAVERVEDLRAVNSKANIEVKRWFRQGELIWCSLDNPIPGPNGSSDSIMFWPGLVEDFKHVSRPEPIEDHPEGNPWVVKQSTTYTVKLLTFSEPVQFRDNKILPYQAYSPSTTLLQALQTVPAEELDFSRDAIAKFTLPEKHADAPEPGMVVSAYALALQIAARLSGYWSLTDDWEFRYSVSTTASVSPATSNNPALQANVVPGTEYAALCTSSYGISFPLAEPGHDIQASTEHMGGVMSVGHGVQTRYQGMWWGAERIWTDDFVRLKIPRAQLAPDGTKDIHPPSGPGPSRVSEHSQRGAPGVPSGAGTRGVFMHLASLFIVDVSRGGNIMKECRASGQLYELADADLHADTETKPADGPSPGSLSQPHAPILLPEPPIGYVFRPILVEGNEAVISLTLISGRYYPRLLSHPLLKEMVTAALVNPAKGGGLMNTPLWALEGLNPGHSNSVDPTKYATTRAKMLRDAGAASEKDMANYMTTESDAMDTEGNVSEKDEPMDVN